VRFAWQHDATRLSDGTIEIFDNEDEPEVESRSRGIAVTLNFTNHTATLLHQWVIPGEPVLANSQGDVQPLPNGDTFVGWGEIGIVSEFTPAGKVSLEMKLPATMNAYREYRYPWGAVGVGRPSIVAKRNGARKTELWVSWNGDTRVARWLVLGGGPTGALKPLGTFTRTGFQTVMALTGLPQRLEVRGLDADGRTLGTSATIRLG
jgi:hypothetical protein